MNYREIRFRIWDVKLKELRYSTSMPDIDFWKHVNHDNSTPIMQWTGLKDINGLLIFEGDIVEIKTMSEGYKNYEVFWREGFACFAIKRPNFIYHFDGDFFDIEDVEIIGNVYENKIEELI